MYCTYRLTIVRLKANDVTPKVFVPPGKIISSAHVVWRQKERIYLTRVTSFKFSVIEVNSKHYGRRFIVVVERCPIYFYGQHTRFHLISMK